MDKIYVRIFRDTLAVSKSYDWYDRDISNQELIDDIRQMISCLPVPPEEQERRDRVAKDFLSI